MRISDWSSDVCSSDLGATAMAISMERAAAARASFTKARFQGIGHEFVSGGGFFRVPASPERRRLRATKQTGPAVDRGQACLRVAVATHNGGRGKRSEEHTSEIPSLIRNSTAALC